VAHTSIYVQWLENVQEPTPIKHFFLIKMLVILGQNETDILGHKNVIKIDFVRGLAWNLIYFQAPPP